MPLLDYAEEFTTKDGQAVTAAAIGTKVIDFGAAIDRGSGEPVVPYARITSTADANPTTSMTVEIIGADNAALDSNPVVLSTISILAAACLKNTVHRMPELKPGIKKRYLGVKLTPVGGDATTGKWIVGLIPAHGRPQNGVNSL